MAIPLLNVAAPSQRLLADKAYGTDPLRNGLAERRIKAVIPQPHRGTRPIPWTAASIGAGMSSSRSSVPQKLAPHHQTIRSPRPQLPRRDRALATVAESIRWVPNLVIWNRDPYHCPVCLRRLCDGGSGGGCSGY